MLTSGAWPRPTGFGGAVGRPHVADMHFQRGARRSAPCGRRVLARVGGVALMSGAWPRPTGCGVPGAWPRPTGCGVSGAWPRPTGCGVSGAWPRRTGCGEPVGRPHVADMHFSAAEENLLVAAFKRFRVILCAAAGGQVLHLPEAHQLRCLPGRGRHAIRHPGCRDGSIHCGVQERSPPVEPGLFCDVRHTRAMGRVSQPGLPFRAAYLPPMGRRGPGFRGAQTKSGDRSRLIPRCCCQRTVGHAGGRQGLW